MREKSAASKVVQEVVERWENSTGFRVKVIRSDRGGEYVNREQQQWCANKGIQQQLTPAYTPQLNCKAERLNHTLIERARAMLHDAQMSIGFWADAVQVAAHIINRSPSTSKYATPFQLFYGHQPSIAHIRVFGAPASVLISAQKRSNKLSPVSEQGVLVGYSEHGHGYRVWVPNKHKVIVSGDVRFDEQPAQQQPAQHTAAHNNCIICKQPLSSWIRAAQQQTVSTKQETSMLLRGEKVQLCQLSRCQPSSHMSNKSNYSNSNYAEALANVALQTGGEHIAVAYSCGIINVAIGQPPQTLTQAMQRPDSSSWAEACDEEMAALQQMNTWQLLPLPARVQPLGLKWVLTTKPAADSSKPRYKARLVIKGCAQRPGEYG